MYQTRTAALLLVLLSGTWPAMAAFTCPPMPVAVTSVNRDIKSDISASIGSLGKIRAGDIAIKTEIEAKNLFAKYPNVDKLLALQTMSATYCEMLKGTTAIPEIEKLDRWEKFQDKVLDLRTKPASTPQSRQNLPRANSALAAKAEGDARLQLSKLSLPFTPLDFVESADAGDLAAVKLFLAAGMDPNATTGSSPNSIGRDKGQTALMAAAARGHVKVVTALVEAGADVNKTNSVFTPVSLAAVASNLDALRFLLTRKVAAPAINDAFISAAGSRNVEALRILVDRGADVKHIGAIALVNLLTRPGPTEKQEGDGDAEVSKIAKALLDAGADPNGKDRDGWTPLLAAALGRYPAAIELLVERGANVNAQCDCASTQMAGATALMMAVKKRGPRSVETLLSKGAAVGPQNHRGESALTIARQVVVESGDDSARRMVQLLSESTRQ